MPVAVPVSASWVDVNAAQIGVGTSGFYQEKPMAVKSLQNVAAVYLGGPHSVAVRADGTLWIWGKSFIENGPACWAETHVPTRLILE